MELTTAQRDRAAGVLLGQAVGDALGVPYEFAAPPQGDAVMKGGGLGPYAPGEWSDDTQMAAVIAQVAATGADLTTPAVRGRIAHGFNDWRQHGASDIGNQTAAVIGSAWLSLTGSAMNADCSKDELDDETWAAAYEQAALAYTKKHERSAGNGALMRNGIVGLVALDDREATARAAAAVAELTHADPLVAESCILHAEAVRVAVVEGVLDLTRGLDLLPRSSQARWADWLESAAELRPDQIEANGSTFGALRVARAAIAGSTDVRSALQLAVTAGHDTDTVAAITGALIGALHGASGIPATWRRRVHGWPGLRARDLVSLALQTAGAAGPGSWPLASHAPVEPGRPLGVRAPFDDGLILGTQADLARTDADAVVSLSRVGLADRSPSRPPENHVECWLVDSDDPAAHNDLACTLADCADAVAELRAEGKTVLLHCVAAQHRTPSVALVYAVRHCGLSVEDASEQIRKALGANEIDGLLWRTAQLEA
ncbi:ADP-ribosylglycohydrolase family protein [Luteipulveratus halotolerans]|uniref:Tyrosine specific protein phosphatases domain-containing protein n=1 Tax=Luteipulveratus halotolerans TaxID=1631356 RepID=A0A0L6CMS4_9MICO|nr:ADP-ribosylglycohydrolase family protein [Luteipulveratus halotolerans]KNX38853.1 hypothetical protein VV01_19690 [Luteipulveratus halotolerans]